MAFGAFYLGGAGSADAAAVATKASLHVTRACGFDPKRRQSTALRHGHTGEIKSDNFYKALRPDSFDAVNEVLKPVAHLLQRNTEILDSQYAFLEWVMRKWSMLPGASPHETADGLMNGDEMGAGKTRQALFAGLLMLMKQGWEPPTGDDTYNRPEGIKPILFVAANKEAINMIWLPEIGEALRLPPGFVGVLDTWSVSKQVSDRIMSTCTFVLTYVSAVNTNYERCVRVLESSEVVAAQAQVLTALAPRAPDPAPKAAAPPAPLAPAKPRRKASLFPSRLCDLRRELPKDTIYAYNDDGNSFWGGVLIDEADSFVGQKVPTAMPANDKLAFAALWQLTLGVERPMLFTGSPFHGNSPRDITMNLYMLLHPLKWLQGRSAVMYDYLGKYPITTTLNTMNSLLLIRRHTKDLRKLSPVEVGHDIQIDTTVHENRIIEAVETHAANIAASAIEDSDQTASASKRKRVRGDRDDDDYDDLGDAPKIKEYSVMQVLRQLLLCRMWSCINPEIAERLFLVSDIKESQAERSKRVRETMKKINQDPATTMSSKERILVELCRRIVANGEKGIVFVPFVFAGDRVCHLLGQLMPCMRIEADQSAAVRSQVVEDFKARAGGAILVMSLKLGSRGISLPEANHVIMISPEYNPATILQGLARVLRVSQMHMRVHIHFLLYTSSVEDWIFNAIVVPKIMDSLTMDSRGAAGRPKEKICFGGVADSMQMIRAFVDHISKAHLNRKVVDQCDPEQYLSYFEPPSAKFGAGEREGAVASRRLLMGSDSGENSEENSDDSNHEDDIVVVI